MARGFLPASLPGIINRTRFGLLPVTCTGGGMNELDFSIFF